MVIEAFLIVSVASFDLAVMPRCSWANQLMLDLVTVTEHIKRMNSLGLGEMSKFHSVICLYRLGSISKENNCAFYEVDGRIAAVFFVGIDKSLS